VLSRISVSCVKIESRSVSDGQVVQRLLDGEVEAEVEVQLKAAVVSQLRFAKTCGW
jgi:molybdopterin-binding protein